MEDVKVCFAVFGGKIDKRVFKSIREVQKLFDKYLDVGWKMLTVTRDIKPSYWGEKMDCWFVCGGDVKEYENHPPDKYDIYVILWKAKGKKTCYGGGTWGPDFGVKDGWLCSIPYDLWDCFLPIGWQWRYRLSQRMSHELLNALHGLGVVKYSVEKCYDYGFRDPLNGWRECHEWILSGGKKKYSWWYKLLMWLYTIFRRWR